MKSGRILGVITQAVVIGVLLFLAIVSLLGVGSGATVFRYQGF